MPVDRADRPAIDHLPPSAAAFLYRATGPCLRIDGEEVGLPGWGTHVIPVGAGDHRVDVWVPYRASRP